MSISNSRLDRFISEKCNVNRKSVRLLVAQKRIKVDGIIVDDVALAINKF
jgi:16S rRNA pseudouridine516 synthase